jgi:RNA polymerase sigma-70 factor (ECF subfamily)
MVSFKEAAPLIAGAGDLEAGLVELAVAGDFDSFAALYSLHLDEIFRYIYFRIGDRQDAEDMTEQVFLKAWEALPNYKSIGCRFINWLYRISHNIVVDHHRSHRNIIAEDDISSEANLPDQAQGNILDKVILDEESATLARAIGKLPQDYQQVIILRFVEGLGHSQIAQILDRSEVACRGIQHRALSLLNKILTGQQERG